MRTALVKNLEQNWKVLISEQFNPVDKKPDYKLKITKLSKNSTSVKNCESMRHKLMPSTCVKIGRLFFLV